MPNLTMYPDQLQSESLKLLKKTKNKRRRQPRPLTPQNVIAEVAEDETVRNAMPVFNPRLMSMQAPFIPLTTSSSTPTPSVTSPSRSRSSHVSSVSHTSSNHLDLVNLKAMNAHHLTQQSNDREQASKQSKAVDQKLDLLIDIMAAQQKLLQSLVAKSNEHADALRCGCRDRHTVDQSVQTESVPTEKAKKPHIIPSAPPSNLQSPFAKYPPIPESQSVGNTNSNGNTSNISSNNNSNSIPVPYEALLKLVLAATNKMQPQQPQLLPQRPQTAQPMAQSMPVHQVNHVMHPPAIQYAYHQNNNHLNHRVHHEPAQRAGDLDCNSTLHFSDC